MVEANDINDITPEITGDSDLAAIVDGLKPKATHANFVAGGIYYEDIVRVNTIIEQFERLKSEKIDCSKIATPENIGEICRIIQVYQKNGEPDLAEQLFLKLEAAFSPNRTVEWMGNELRARALGTAKASEATDDVALSYLAWSRLYRLSPDNESAKRRVYKYAKMICAHDIPAEEKLSIYQTILKCDPEHEGFKRKYIQLSRQSARFVECIEFLLTNKLSELGSPEIEDLSNRANRAARDYIANSDFKRTKAYFNVMKTYFPNEEVLIVNNSRAVRAFGANLVDSLIANDEIAAHEAVSVLNTLNIELAPALIALSRYSSAYFGPELAISYLERVLVIDPENPIAIRDIGRLQAIQ